VSSLISFFYGLILERLRARNPQAYERVRDLEDRIGIGIFRLWIRFGLLVLLGVFVYVAGRTVGVWD
jgi:hypothetical protein